MASVFSVRHRQKAVSRLPQGGTRDSHVMDDDELGAPPFPIVYRLPANPPQHQKNRQSQTVCAATIEMLKIDL